MSRPTSYLDALLRTPSTTPLESKTVEKKCYILRGLPGAGKTYRARELSDGLSTLHCGWHNTDQYFMVTEKGKDERVYKYDHRHVQEYHDRNFNEFVKSIKQEKPIVIVDNTNTRRLDYNRYVIVARQAGYTVIEEIVGERDPETGFFTPEFIELCISRNIHKVPQETVERMAKNFEF